MSKREIITKRKLNTAMLLAVGTVSSPLYAAVTASNSNFTMLSPAGASVTGGANDVAFTWDGTLNTSTAIAVSNATLTSNTPFFGLPWTAYNVKVYGPGTYTVSTADAVGGSGCPTVVNPANCASAGNYNVTVNPGQIMAHMKFAYGSTEGIDVINVWVPGDWTTLNGNLIYTQTPQGRGVYTGPIYSLVSIDGDGDNVPGAQMLDGPFQGFNANFSVNAGGNVASPPPCVDFTICPSDIIDAPSPNTGCAISPSAVNALERADWGLLAGFLAWLGAIRMRFKRPDQS